MKFTKMELRLGLKMGLLTLVVLILSSCAKIYYTPDAMTLAKKQKLIAIVPPSVSIAASKKIDAESLKEQQKTESINFQKEIYAWLLKRKRQGKFKQEIQGIETTNALLKRAHFSENPLTPNELCKTLKVDGIIMANFQLSHPISNGGAVALYLFTGSYASTNQIHASLSIHDFSHKKLIWNYDHKFSGSIGSTPASLVDLLMRKASRKMPYIISPTY